MSDDLIKQLLDRLDKIEKRLGDPKKGKYVNKSKKKNIKKPIIQEKISKVSKTLVEQPSTKKVKKRPAYDPPIGNSKGSPCRIEPINLRAKRKNQFIELGLQNECKADIDIDKKLVGKNTPTKRGKTRLITIDCRVCGREYTISPSLVLRTDEGYTYTCDKCLSNNKSRLNAAE
jgi:hypothetical protein